MASNSSSSSSSSSSAPAVPELETELLTYLDDRSADHEIADSMEWLKEQGKEDQHEKFVGILLSLVGYRYVLIRPIDHSRTVLSVEGEKYRAAGSPEYQLYSSIPADSAMASKDIESQISKPVFQLGLMQCMAKRWVEFEGDRKAGMLKRKIPNAVDEVQQALQSVHDGAMEQVAQPMLDQLKKRGLITVQQWKTYAIKRGASFARVRKQLATDLTADMLKGDKWKELDFKEYNFDAAGETPTFGALHPLMKVRSAFRQIFIEMGFEEMPTNQYVESSFWNFDTLFQPQQHPARDAHDTFFIANPKAAITLPEEYLKATKEMHEKGGYGSIGYRYDWKREEAEKNILRTHTTAVSSRMLYKLSQQQPFKPKRYFSIDRVFRNETLDATHLAEFYQIEGLIADRNLTLGDLIGTISTFFKRVGIADVKFKPAYNPYTEPSMEIFGYSTHLNKWIELGNCFPETDHEVLTEQGFMKLDGIERAINEEGSIRVACYDQSSTTIVYRDVGKDRLIISPSGQHDIVNLVDPSLSDEKGKTKNKDQSASPSSTAAAESTGRQHSNHVSFSVTPNHELYIRKGHRSATKWHWEHKDDAKIGPAKVKAKSLLNPGDRDGIQLVASASGGLSQSEEVLPFVSVLGLKSDDEIAAFLEFYGYWIGDGSLHMGDHTITFQPTKSQDWSYLDALLARLPIQRVGSYSQATCGWWKGNSTNRDGSWSYAIGAQAWWQYFSDEYGVKYPVDDPKQRFIPDPTPIRGKSGPAPKGPTCRCTWCDAHIADTRGSRKQHRKKCKGSDPDVEMSVDDSMDSSSVAASSTPVKNDVIMLPARAERAKQEREEEEVKRELEGKGVMAPNVKSAKWFWYWVFKLGINRARLVVKGLRFADGDQSTHDARRVDTSIVGGQIWTSSVRARDEYIRLLLHAGFSAHFTMDTKKGVVNGVNKHGVVIQATATSWCVHYSDQPKASEPALVLKDSVSIGKFNGRVWCVNVPHPDHLIIVRRVLKEVDGVVEEASRPVVVGNSGMFRPEMLRPMGLPEDVRVIAWGLGLERQTMLVYGIKHIRDLFGPKVKLDIIQRNPICRFDKNEVE